MGSHPIEKEIVALENQFWQALKSGDTKAALRLTDNPSIVAGAQGVASIDHAAFEKMMSGPAGWKLEDYKLSDTQVRVLSEDVAVIAYKVHEELTVDGKPVAFDAADSSTWVRRNGAWVCAMHSEAIAGDPLGRDRR